MVYAVIILLFGVSATLKIWKSKSLVSSIANSILAVREKTFLLEEVVCWMEKSDYREYKLVLCNTVGNPASSANAIDRKFRPPTSEEYYNEGLTFEK